MRGRPFIFNLGHGVLPETPPEHVGERLVGARDGGWRVKLAVVLFNLGGPDSPEAVEPFLRNLFSDPAIIALPAFAAHAAGAVHRTAARAVAREIYAKIGGRSPILEETQAQARALETVLQQRGHEARSFIAMRCWQPFSEDSARAVKAFGTGQNRSAAALSAVLHHHDRILVWRLGQGCSKTGIDRANIAHLLLSAGWRALFRAVAELIREALGEAQSRASIIGCCFRRMACRSAPLRAAIPINGRSSKVRPPLWMRWG